MVALPLAGVSVYGGFHSDFLEFPPRTRYMEHASFSFSVFICLMVFILIVVLPFIIKVAMANIREFRRVELCSRPDPESSLSDHLSSNKWALPSLIAGLALIIIFWVISWSRFAIFANFQIFTFIPLWVAYIIVVNSLLWIKSGRCMMVSRPKYFFVLFCLSAFFWWFFEYLNRFTRNWHYLAIDKLTASSYFFIATLAFSTVLPAVLGTYELLASFPRVSAGLDDFIKIEVRHPRITAWSALTIFAIGLALIGIFPDYLFPLLWIAPLGILVSAQVIYGRTTILSDLVQGDWRRVALLAFSALICGFFWEMWNWHSLAKWIYEVPYVNRYKVFEMPILGYSGYLPFGLECALVAEFFTNKNMHVRKQ